MAVGRAVEQPRRATSDINARESPNLHKKNLRAFVQLPIRKILFAEKIG
jgi:hypothetical protein